MKYFIWLLFILSIILNYFYHSIVLNNDTFKKKYNINVDVKDDYRHFFFLQDHDPIFVFKNQILDKYTKYSFENKKPWLVYPNQQTIVDLDYIENIQYSASYINSYEAKFLYNDFNYITNLSPYFLAVYNLWELILPAWKTYKDFRFKQKIKTWKNTVKLWEKWVYFNCNENKIKNILSLSDKEYLKIAYSKTWVFYEKNSNPCPDIDLPSTLWFNYFYYLKDLKNTIKYYKIAWFQKSALPWIIWMVAVANWLLWEHEKTIYLLLEKVSWLYDRLKEKNISDKKAKIIKRTIQNSIKRAEEELNLYIISQTDKKNPNCDKDYNCLEKKWFIKKEIDTLINECKKDKDLIHIKTVQDLFSKNIKKTMSDSKCFLLSVWLQSWLINRNWKLKSALLKWWTYYYDTDRQWWWVHILEK